MEGYSVSNQCMALVRDGCLLPTLDAAELGFIRESSDKQYVPDVFYKVSNIEYWLNRPTSDVSNEDTREFGKLNIERTIYSEVNSFS